MGKGVPGRGLADQGGLGGMGAPRAGRDPAQVKSIWSRLTFTGKAQPPKQLPDSAAVKKAVAADPKGVGYIEKSAVDASVKAVLTLD